ncbi:hypothetical protein N7492_008489 [Penicillium capsulatum]|uniref:Uncharacterized protein n=1 Tax=Penicillium capsulatum TaxID=69766 RepID=A0A9W9HS80_9EURO|nr:hypothetical protein N7492_008476 [Penicillium capsulatum]KAJ5155686.1 hypothetical protein N7492_008489 [Penicillium capsulatum]KAJ6105877.1 hypothetical protein N7512_009394 [Penicillium capsulatum]KAJ6105891.1 hypothetical protein N7512_009408 [Penicillium capsulatum]
MEGLDREHDVLLEPLDSLPGMLTGVGESLSHLEQDQNQALPPDVFENDNRPPASDPFKPLMEELGRLGQVDPQVSHQASEIVRLYSRLWDAYVAKAADSQRLQIANEELRTTNAHLCQEQVFMERRHVKHAALLAHFGQAFGKLRQNIVGLLKDWEDCSSESIRENESRSAEEVS